MRIDLLLGLVHGEYPITCRVFQYPRADRLIVGDGDRHRTAALDPVSVSSCGSTYCWGLHAERGQPGAVVVSVSSCGSTYCWGIAQIVDDVLAGRFSILVRIDLLLGAVATPSALAAMQFQYPRADRLIVGGAQLRTKNGKRRCFSILVRIDLLLGPPAR